MFKLLKKISVFKSVYLYLCSEILIKNYFLLLTKENFPILLSK